MSTLAGMLIGLTLAIFGFAGMRNPMRLFWPSLVPGMEGYRQRMVLDPTMRNELRVVGALVSLFGTSILTASLGAMPRFGFFGRISEGLWVLMGCIFFSAWVVGLMILVWQLFQGESFNWFKAWKDAAQFGPIEMFPTVTPRMQREARVFSITFLGLVILTAIASLFR